MQKITQSIRAVLAIALFMFSTLEHALSAGEQPGAEAGKRELIYCADKMTHEERDAYRARMSAARTQAEKAALRQAHQEEMQARVHSSGGDVEQCLPLRLRQRGGKSQ